MHAWLQEEKNFRTWGTTCCCEGAEWGYSSSAWDRNEGRHPATYERWPMPLLDLYYAKVYVAHHLPELTCHTGLQPTAFEKSFVKHPFGSNIAQMCLDKSQMNLTKTAQHTHAFAHPHTSKLRCPPQIFEDYSLSWAS